VRALPPDPREAMYSELFICCACMESKKLDEFVVANCGHAVLCRECWEHYMHTPRSHRCPWCRGMVWQWRHPRTVPSSQRLYVYDPVTQLIRTGVRTGAKKLFQTI
jgi:hypothetical protein